MTLTALVFGDGVRDRIFAGRTVRSVQKAGGTARSVIGRSTGELAATLDEIAGPVWLIRAGAWRGAQGTLVPPRASATGAALCAIGWPIAAFTSCDRGPPGDRSPGEDRLARWRQLYADCGGDLSEAVARGLALPPMVSALLEPRAAHAVALRLRHGTPIEAAVAEELCTGRHRVVRYAPLDVCCDDRLRCLQVVTSLQRGGAERITLELARALRQRDMHCRIATIGRPTRQPFPTPPGTIDLSSLRGDREARAAALARVAAADGADVVHAHLLDGDDLARLSRFALPVVATVHNMRPGWQPGQGDLQAGDSGLLAGCSLAVSRELREARIPIPIRTVWNAIDAGALATCARDAALRERVRRRHGVAADEIVLLSLANPRPQKRLPQLVTMAAALRDRMRLTGDLRAVHLWLAGEASSHPAAQHTVAETNARIARQRLSDSVKWLGAVDDVAEVLAAADVLVCASEYEGLSLAHLEAAAAGLPVVATDAGGTRELECDALPIHLVPLDVGAEAFAEAVARILQQPNARTPRALKNFSLAQMADRYARLYARAIVASGGRQPPEPLDADSPARISSRHSTRCDYANSRPQPAEAGSFGHDSGFPDPSVAEAASFGVPNTERINGRVYGHGLWLITNNFSTGGAQSSARRLLAALHAQGIAVRAAVLQEHADNPTPGRQALVAAGIRVAAFAPAGTIDAADAVDELLAEIDVDPPQSVLFWNVIPEYKLLIADGLLDTPVFDASPGEMYFESLARYFARPRVGLPYRAPSDYGQLLSGAIVKYHAEVQRAAEMLGCPVHVIPNGVPIPERRTRPSRNGRVAIGTVARISPQKRLEDLFAALAAARPHLPPFVLRIAGGPESGAEDYALRLRAQAEGLPIEWLGDVTDVPAFLGELDLFAQVSEPAGCPNASLEALAAGLPVIATDVGGASEQVIDGHTGRLVPRRDPTAFAEALVELCGNPDLGARLAVAGRQHAATHFALERMVADYRRLCLR